MNADQFRERMTQLPEPITDKKPPYWEAWRLDLWRRAQTQDPARFWEWPCVYHTMLVNHWYNPVKYEYSTLITRLLDACRVPHAGPVDNFKVETFSPYDPFQNNGLSKNLIHQAYHVNQWEQTTGRKIDTLDTIVEFGGGYGAMALLCHRLGFKGKYIIYDLPEFALLQEYYLSQFGINAEWNPKRRPKGVDLFMALYSISEVDPLEREKLMVRANSYLLLYSGQWEKWNNVVWAKNFAMGTVLEWRHTELTHLPDKNNWYSIGW